MYEKTQAGKRLHDFLDALASKKAGEPIVGYFSDIVLNGESLIGVDFCRCVFNLAT